MGIGVDGTKNGWVVSTYNFKNRDLKIDLISQLNDLKFGSKDLILIDIPLGLASKKEKFRECDTLARTILKKRAVTLFSPPLIEAFKSKEYKEALEINRKYIDKGFSKQAWNLKPKMLEARNFAKGKLEIYESHPELCFTALNNQIPLSNSKHTEEGIKDRLRLLEKLDLKTKYKYKIFLEDFKKMKVTKDDILDSLVLSYSASNIIMSLKNRVLIPTKEMVDKDGLSLQICYSSFLTS